MRWLYLLALAQLVGGPLVLLQVTMFCKVAMHEVPRAGVAKAAAQAWHSDDFQAVLAVEESGKKGDSKSPSPSDPAKVKLEKSKLHAAPWESTSLAIARSSSLCKVVDHARIWTPAWPQAPPGPPPRVV
ncbi:hypothetical protein JIN84_01305 [Luteolibacter yonseiensis]|uniref:Uncharacterized protein n=1 Tax=Luteolibacter yonseiensis TaxID=1144680 RepID=A0A934R017_9BACT|nr:hypothetical protein [Luteolibacter yonseiensis]MBK1814244.1 hypothetical protein [Luteolibacter yonseiensis]